MIRAAAMLDPYSDFDDGSGEFRRSAPEPWDGGSGETAVKP